MKSIKKLNVLIYGMLGISGVFAFDYCFAALPPFFQSSKEIINILNNQAIAEKIGSGRGIESIIRNKDGYTITARECTLEVIVNYLPAKEGMVGPANYEVKPGEFRCNELKETDLEQERD